MRQAHLIGAAIREKVHKVGKLNFTLQLKNKNFIKIRFSKALYLNQSLLLQAPFFWQNICENVFYPSAISQILYCPTLCALSHIIIHVKLKR